MGMHRWFADYLSDYSARLHVVNWVNRLDKYNRLILSHHANVTQNLIIGNEVRVSFIIKYHTSSLMWYSCCDIRINVVYDDTLFVDFNSTASYCVKINKVEFRPKNSFYKWKASLICSLWVSLSNDPNWTIVWRNNELHFAHTL